MKKQKDTSLFDFGFSFVDEEAKSTNDNIDFLNNKDRADDLENRLQTLYSSIIPFLDNLCKNPEKSTIYWPNRIEKIEAYKKKLQQIVEGKLNG